MAMHRTSAALAGCALIVCAAPCSYGQAVADGPIRDEERWFGWQTLAVDAIAPSVAFGGLRALGDNADQGSPPPTAVVIGLGLTAYALGPPLVHLAHGHLGTALADTAIRLTAPALWAVIGGLVDVALSPNECAGSAWCFSGLRGAVIGSAFGYASAIAYDAVFLAREPVPVATRRASLVRTPAGGVAISPTLAAGRRGLNVGIAGSF
jgi:hypothetical protein